MAEITNKVKLLLIILIISFIINLGIGITSMAINNSNTIPTDSYNNTEIKGNGGSVLLGIIGIPTFFIPFMSIVSLSSLNIPIEIFSLISVFLVILESIKTLLYVLMFINLIPTINV